jgi:thiol-disulfide isomerase/thioredoxin
MVMRSRTLMLALVPLALAACGAADVESSGEYTNLLAEGDELAGELDALTASYDDVDDQLAVAESKLADAEDELADVEDELAAIAAVGDDLASLLVLDVMNRTGLERAQAECIGAAFVDDDELRAHYLLLIDNDAAQVDRDASEAAFDAVTVALGDCGVEVPVVDEEAQAASQAQVVALLGEVEVTGGALPRLPDGTADPAIGTPAPVMTGADYDGNPVAIDAAAHGPTMVIVMAHWCPHCNAEVPKINQLRDEGRIPEGVEIVAVSSALNPDAPNFPPDQWLLDVDWTFPVIADGVNADGSFVGYETFGVSGVPFVVLIDGDGNVVQRWAGERDIAFIEASLVALAATG